MRNQIGLLVLSIALPLSIVAKSGPVLSSLDGIDSTSAPAVGEIISLGISLPPDI